VSGMSPAGISILVLVVAVGAGLLAWAGVTGAQGWREDHAARGGAEPEGARHERPRGPVGRLGRSPSPWVALTVLLLLLGVVVAPRLLGVTFVFLPLLWMHRRRGPGPWRGPGRGGPGSRGDEPPDDRT
jgi:hypothetical protein